MSILSSIGDALGAITPGVGSVLSGLASGASSLLGGMNTNSAAAASVQQQENFSEQARLNTYPDTVASLEAAGLNPMLAYSQGGLPMPASSTYMPVNALGNAVNSAMSGASLPADLANTRAQAATTRSQLAVNSANVANTNADTANKLKDLQVKGLEGDTAGAVDHAILPMVTSLSNSANSASSFMGNVIDSISDVVHGKYNLGAGFE